MNAIIVAVMGMAALGITGCKISSGGYYAGSGIYNDNDGYSGWASDHNDSWSDREHDWSDDRSSRNEEKERERYEEQKPNDTSDLHPPGVKPRALEMAVSSRFQSTDSRVITVADKYDISDYAATYIVRAVELAKADDDSGVKDLGLEAKDFEKMMKSGKLSSEKIEALASRLLMTTERTEQLLFDIKNDVQRANEK